MSGLLDRRERRRDLNSREISSILGGLIGSLVENTQDPNEVRKAVRWWAETDEAWTILMEVDTSSR